MDTRTEKHCPQCGETKMVTEFFVKDAAKGRTTSWCKACYKRIQAEKYKHRFDPKPEKSPKLVVTERSCVACGTVKAITEFRPRKATCRACANAKQTANYAADPERIKAIQARYRDAHRDDLRERAYQRYTSGDPRYGPEKARAWREEQPELGRTAVKRYRQAHPDLNRITVAKRRARRLGAEGNYTLAEWEALKAQHDFRCLQCLKQEPEVALTAGHVVPLTRGGSNDIGNIQPLCQPCNSRKHTRTEDWRIRYAILKAKGEV